MSFSGICRGELFKSIPKGGLSPYVSRRCLATESEELARLRAYHFGLFNEIESNIAERNNSDAGSWNYNRAIMLTIENYNEWLDYLPDSSLFA
jgi:hypothetical protein